MTQTVGDLLNQFNLQLDLKPEVLDLKIPGEYTSFRKKGVELSLKRMFCKEIFKTRIRRLKVQMEKN